jgi:hypothetical protein
LYHGGDGDDAATASWIGREGDSVSLDDIPSPTFEETFRLEARVAAPVVVGQDDIHGRRQLIEILDASVTGRLTGHLMPGGVDSQIIRPDGFTELVARYALELDDGERVYINNAGIRRITDPEAAAVAAGGTIVDPRYVYFVTVPTFETYSEEYRWLERSIFFCYGARTPDTVLLRFFEIK